MHYMRQSNQDLTGNALSAGLIKRAGQLEAALAASQADVRTIKKGLVRQESQHSASRCSMSTAAKQHRRLTRQHASLKKALRRSDRQKAVLQQKAVQLQQLLTSVMDMGCSMQQANSSMGTEMQLLGAELGKIQDQLATLHKHAESTKIKAGVEEEVDDAAGGTSTKQTLKQVTAGYDASCAWLCCDMQFI